MKLLDWILYCHVQSKIIYAAKTKGMAQLISYLPTNIVKKKHSS